MLFVWVIVLGLIQSVSYWNLDFLALLAIFAGLKKGPVFGLLAGGAIGLFAEILSSTTFGLNISLYSMVGLLCGLFKSHVAYKENILTEFIFSFFGVIFFYSGYFIFTRTFQSSVLFTAFFSAIAAPLLFRIVGRSKPVGEV